MGTQRRGLLASLVLAVAMLAPIGAARAAGPLVTFAPKLDVGTGMAMSVAIADLNGDSVADLVVGSDAVPSASLSVYLGQGAGGFGPPTDFPVGGSGPRQIVVQDLNGDTFPDLTTVTQYSNSVSVLLGDGTGDFATHVDYATGNGPYSVAVADLNADTRLDLVVANYSADSISVLLGDGAGRFGAREDFTTGGDNPDSVALGDLNADSYLDVVVAHEWSDVVSVLLADPAAGTLSAPLDYSTGHRSSAVALSDLNADGKLDMVVSNFQTSGGTVSVHLGNGRGGFGERAELVTADHPKTLALADLNGDASPDVVTSNGSGVSVLLADGIGGFGTHTDYATGPTWGMAVGAVDGDSRLDVVTANGWGYSASVLLNTTEVVPSAPTAPGMLQNAVAGNESAVVSWSPPAWDGGSPIIGYVVTPYIGPVSQGPRFFVSGATTQTVRGLTNGTTYRFRVRAWNALGVSSFSKISNTVVPRVTVPGAPTIGSAAPGDGQATVSWTAPASDGGAPIIGYVVTPYVGYVSQGPRFFVSTATTQTVPQLANGVTYRFKVRAWSSIGVSGFSAASNAVTPFP